MELDHVFILCEVGAPEASALCRLGLVEGPPNTHPGQGTACRRFFFRNAYLELLWVHDEREARSASVRPTRLRERWSQRGRDACPFGIVLRPGAAAADARPPFPTWTYSPGYLLSGLAIDVAVDTPLDEPEFFWMGFRRDGASPVPEPGAQAIAATLMTDVRMGMPKAGPYSMAARAAEAAGLLSFDRSSEFELGLTFDGAGAGRKADLRPHLPLVVHW